jgi:hypothetical protein
VTALARPRSNGTVNCRPVLSSERALQNDKVATVSGKFQRESKFGRGSQRETGGVNVSRKLTSTSTEYAQSSKSNVEVCFPYCNRIIQD